MESSDRWIGEVVDGYRILEVLGRGGMGVVYRAENQALRRIEALKVIAPVYARDPYFRRRFQREAQALGRIHHPNIVGIHTLRESELGLFLTMEYVDGDTLADRIRDHGPLPWTDTLPIVSQLLDALAYAHNRGIIHRDIKPRNVMLTPDETVKVMDFGLARFFREATETRTQGTTGTLYYMAPEQIVAAKTLDQRCDLYALGMTLYELLTGRLPFDETDSHYVIQRAIVEEVFPPPIEFRTDLPPRLSEVIHRAVAKDPTDRFPSARAMQQAIDAVVRAEQQGAVGDADVTVTRPAPGRGARASSSVASGSSTADPGVSSRSGSVPSRSRAWRWWTGGAIVVGLGMALFVFGPEWTVQADDPIPRADRTPDAFPESLSAPASDAASAPSLSQSSSVRSTGSSALGASVTDLSSPLQEQAENETQDGGATPPDANRLAEASPEALRPAGEEPEQQPPVRPPPEENVETKSPAATGSDPTPESSPASPDASSSVSETDPEAESRPSRPPSIPSSDDLASERSGDGSETTGGSTDDRSAEDASSMSPTVLVERDAARLADAVGRAIERREWTTLPDPVERYYQRALKSLYARHDVVSAQVVPQPPQDEGGRVVMAVATFVSYRQRGRDGVKAVPIPARWIWKTAPTGVELIDVIAD